MKLLRMLEESACVKGLKNLEASLYRLTPEPKQITREYLEAELWFAPYRRAVSSPREDAASPAREGREPATPVTKTVIHEDPNSELWSDLRKIN